MKLSLIQIVDQLEDLATNHEQINDFDYGDVWEISTDTRRYPLMFVEHSGGTTSSTNDRGKVVGYTFSIYFMDKVDKDEANELNVLSDQLRIAFDIRAMLNDLDTTVDLDQMYTTNTSWTTFTESKPDSLAGVQLSITINTTDLFDYCQVPNV